LLRLGRIGSFEVDLEVVRFRTFSEPLLYPIPVGRPRPHESRVVVVDSPGIERLGVLSDRDSRLQERRRAGTENGEQGGMTGTAPRRHHSIIEANEHHAHPCSWQNYT